jgi:porphobilinogen synthase
MDRNRYRRLRKNEVIRKLVSETTLSPTDLIQPFFIIDGKNKSVAIDSMPGIQRFTTDKLLHEIEAYIKLGGRAGLLFGVSEKKDLKGDFALDEQGLIPKSIRLIKKEFPEFLVITDVCLCAYLKHGHCGILSGELIDNDASLPILSRMALSHSRAGADFVAPSDMMDFRVVHIRQALDNNNQKDTGIISYSVKYASAFYGPFREAAHSSPSFGNRKTYQMDFGNIKEAVKEAHQDIAEGADIVMVKPAMAYLDVISRLNQSVLVPIAAYHVSGEYAMIKAAAQKKWIDEKNIVIESLTAIKRAGAKIIFTYYAKDVLKWL